MRYVEIQDDWLVGTIPDALGTGWKKLHTFLVGGNVLGGGFPSTFAKNDMLGTLFIDRNRFNGTFPAVFSTLNSLEWLDAENNEFTGTVPDSIATLKNLSESCLLVIEEVDLLPSRYMHIDVYSHPFCIHYHRGSQSKQQQLNGLPPQLVGRNQPH